MAKTNKAPNGVPALEGIVHYVLSADDTPNVNALGKHRPAIVVEVQDPSDTVPEGTINLQVFTDGAGPFFGNDGLAPVLWKTGVLYNSDGLPGTWHFLSDVTVLPADPATEPTA